MIAGCDSGPAESEIAAACLQEAARGANRALRRELGVQSEAFCRCMAGQAKAHMSAEGQRVLLLDLQGRGGEARAISSGMNESEQAALKEGAFRLLEKCGVPTR